MIRKLSLMLLVMLTMFGMEAQGLPGGGTPMPLNPKVISGVLDNGLSYYILHNEEPKGKANFYIAQKVGSTMEEANQLGLAHFLEHMAFNGTTHYPGKTMLEYLQSKGIRFGADINAGTGYDQTVYNINNVTTSDKNLMDSVLLVLRDWSDGILLEQSELDAERGVIREEMRSREDAMERMWRQVLPQIYDVFPYQHTIIGTEQVIMNFTQEEIRDYYHKWYRPDLQGIIIVGDFDAEEMENKVKQLFSTVVMPENVPERTFPVIGDNEEPIYAYYSDPEMQFILTLVSFKEEAVPFELRNTVEMYMGNDLMKLILRKLFNNRLNENALSPDCPYSSAGVSFNNFLIAKAADAFTIQIISKTDATAGVQNAMSIVAQACQTGFTVSEYDRVKDEILADVEKQYNERDKTNNAVLARELYTHFLDNEPTPGIEQEYQLIKQVLPMLPLEMINGMLGELMTSDNMVVVTAQPEKEGLEVISKETMISTINNAMNAQYEAYEDETIDEPLIATLPQPGKVVSKTEDSVLGTVTYTLSNGVKVVTKTTDFAADEILVSGFRKGGKQIYEKSQAPDVLMMDLVFQDSKFGPFDKKMLTRYLSGKKASIGFAPNAFTDDLSGRSTVKDLKVLMELFYTAFTNLSADPEAYRADVERYKPLYQNLMSNPEFLFQVKAEETVYCNNPLLAVPTYEVFEQADYDRSLALVKKALGNAADYTFVFVGNIDEATFVPMLEQYFATLPAGKVTEPKIVTPVEVARGQVVNDIKQPMQTPTVYIQNLYSGNNVTYTVKNTILTTMAGKLLRNIYLESLREDEGGTYSPQVTSDYETPLKLWEIEYEVVTAPEKKEKIMARADSEIAKMFADGTDAVTFNKIKEAEVQQYQIQKNRNGYWNVMLKEQLQNPEVNIISDYESALNSITLDEFNSFIKTMYNGENRIQIIMSPEN